MNPILKAAQFAREAHGDQRRKYTGRPYIEHPARVAARVAIHPAGTETMVIAAWLHDVLEDTDIGLEVIANRFGEEVAQLVEELTNPSKGSPALRAERKAQDREHLARVSRPAKIIKLLDRIDNLRDMEGAPQKFLSLYLEESRLLAASIGNADAELVRELEDVIASRTHPSS
jgi:(p)ppGpp synthase/HD superfamily hydrolase